MSEVCSDNRFELIEEFKDKMVKGTNIESSPEEMAVLDNFLFRIWQMGWLDKLKAQEHVTGETSDGYHTFNELYHHRAVLFSVIVANYPDMAWKSKKHHDGTMYDNMFIVGIDTPDGQATYHYDVDPYWDMFKCRVLDNAPEWDGHTPAQAIERIGKLKAQKPRVMTLEELDALGDNAIVWLECLYTVDGMKTTTLQPAIYQSENSSPEEDGYYCVVSSWSHSGFFHKDNYSGDWRCWTSRPSDEQRKATAWDR